eukprot:scaffold264739_cov19-Tisochrysis_lutea.AAC.1
MGMQSVSDDVRGLWYEVTMDVQGRVPVPGDTTELQNAVTKAGKCMKFLISTVLALAFAPSFTGSSKSVREEPLVCKECTQCN